MRRRTSVTMAAAAVAVGTLWAAPVAAHVGASIESQDGSTVTVAFTFHHGCDGAATDGLDVKVPDGATDVTTQDPAGWTSTVEGGVIAWRGEPIPDGADGRMVATMVVDGATGETVSFPTIQICGDATADWIEPVGADGTEPEHVAPSIVLGEVGPASTHSEDDGHDDGHDDGDDGHDDGAKDDDHGDDAGVTASDSGTAEATSEVEATETAASTSEDDSGVGTAAVVGGVVVVAALVGGGILIANRRGLSRPS